MGKIVVLDEEDDEYTLNTPKFNADSGFTAGTSTDAAVDEDGKLNKMAIAADAIVFVKDGDDYSVTTGAKLADSAAIVSDFWWDEDDATGFSTVVLAYATSAVDSISDLMYGYVTAEALAVENADGDPVYEVTFWDGVEKTLLTVKGEDELKVGDAFSYKLEDGAMNIQNVYADGVLAITKWNGKDLVLEDLTSYTFEVDEDTVIIYVDTDKDTGVEGGKIVLATKSDGVNLDDNIPARDDDGDKVVEVIFVDVNNLWK